MLRALLFDFDGVIVLSEPLHYAAFAEVFAAHGVTLTERDYYARYLSYTDREAIDRLVEDSGRLDLRSKKQTIFREKAAAMARRIDEGVPLCPGVEAFIAVAAARPAALAVVSAAIRSEIETVLRRIRLRECFAQIVSADDVRTGKPDPEGYLLGVDRLRGTIPALDPRQCLAIEDSPKGIDAAQAAGLRVLALPHTRPRSELRAADFFAESYADVDWQAIDATYR